MLCTSRVNRISGRSASRAMLVEAFATEPDVFLLDELTGPVASHAFMLVVRRSGAHASREAVVVPYQAAATMAAFDWSVGVDRTPRPIPPC